MSSKKIAKQIKKEILSCDCDYDYIYHMLEDNFEETVSGILNSYLYLFRNINNINNNQTLDNLDNLLTNYVKNNKNKKMLELLYDKIQVFLDNIGRSLDYIELMNVEKYISNLVYIQNKCLINPMQKKKKCGRNIQDLR